jgi:hypothetical protein
MEMMNASNFIFFCSLAIAFVASVAWAGIIQRISKQSGWECDEPFNLIKPARLTKDKNPLSGSGWSGSLISVGGILGTVLSTDKNQAFSDFSILFVVIFIVASLLDATVYKPFRSGHFKSGSKRKLRRMSQHVAGGLALWSVVGQIWATWFLLSALTLTPLLIGAARLFLITAVLLVVAYDVLDFFLAQEAHAAQQKDQAHVASPLAQDRPHSTNTGPLPTRQDMAGELLLR